LWQLGQIVAASPRTYPATAGISTLNLLAYLISRMKSLAAIHGPAVQIMQGLAHVVA
jgi:hypothetical protein